MKTVFQLALTAVVTIAGVQAANAADAAADFYKGKQVDLALV